MSARRLAWSELAVDRPMDNVERRRVVGEKAMLSMVTLQRGVIVPMHSHENEQFVIIEKGKLRFLIGADKREVVLGPGEVLYLSSNEPHWVEVMEDTVVLDVFSPPSEKTGVDRR